MSRRQIETVLDRQGAQASCLCPVLLAKSFLIHHKQTPIDMEGLAGDVGTGTGGQKDHRPGKVLRYLDPAERDIFLELEKERTVVGMHRGVHGARSDGVHANVLRSHVLSRRPRQRA